MHADEGKSNVSCRSSVFSVRCEPRCNLQWKQRRGRRSRHEVRTHQTPRSLDSTRSQHNIKLKLNDDAATSNAFIALAFVEDAENTVCVLMLGNKFPLL